MSLLKTRPTMDALQRIMTSFKQFERKLDKLQDDVSCHGQTLHDLRILVGNLSSGTIANPDSMLEETKRIQKKTTVTQCDKFDEHITKTRRKNAIQPFPAKIKARSFQNQGSRMFDMPFHGKLKASPKAINPTKHSQKSLRPRPSKAEAPRKATMLGKNMDRKRGKMQKS